MRVLYAVVLLPLLFSCSLSPRIEPVKFSEMIGDYEMVGAPDRVDRLTLKPDSTFMREIKTSDGRTFVDHGKWYLHLLGSRQNSPYIKIQLDNFVTHFAEDSTTTSLLDPIPGGIADSIPYPREARIWKSPDRDKVTIRIGQYPGPAWAKVETK